MFGLKRKREEAIAVEEVGTHRLYLHASEEGWQTHLIDPGKPDKPRGREGTLEKITEQGAERLEACVRLAVDSLSRKEHDQIEEIRLLIDDPDVYYTDTRGEIFANAAPSTLRMHGAELLSTKSVTFGQSPFGKISESGSQAARNQGVIAFLDVKRLAGYLSRLDRLGTRVNAIVPVADVLVHRARQVGEVYGGIYLSGEHTHIVLANPKLRAVLVRVIPVGPWSFINKLSEAEGITVAEAVQSIQKRKILSDIHLPPETDDGLASLNLRKVDRDLGPIARRLFDGIANTVTFFEHQWAAGRPARLEVYGKEEHAPGIIELLRQNGLSVTPVSATKPLFTQFLEQPASSQLNLLSELGDDIRVGSVSYSFRNNKLQAQRAGTRSRPVAGAASKPASTATRGRRPAGRPNRRDRARAGSAGTGQGGGFLSGLIGKMDRTATAPDGEDGESLPNEKAYFALCAVLMLALFYHFWTVFTVQETRLWGASSGTTSAADTIERLQRQIANSTVNIRQRTETRLDKVLWTEKFLSLADNMGDTIWLTDVYLDSAKRATGGVEVETQILAINGAVLPSTDGHLLEIANYVERLENDDKTFMSDFREIRFSGARIDEKETDEVIRFAIEAVYDENKRIQQQQGEESLARAKEGGARVGDLEKIDQERRRSMEAASGIASQ